jgi:hypothetical protein
MKRLLVILALSVLATSCGGGGGSSTYTAAPSERCLTKAGVKVGHNVDFVASTALGGSFRATLADNSVTVALGRTADEGDNLDQAYRRFHAKNVGIDDVLRRQQNAVLLWHVHPSDADVATVTGCLKSGT